MKVLDFGLAKALEQRGASERRITVADDHEPGDDAGMGIILGTAAYMSPGAGAGQAGRQAHATSGRLAACSTKCSLAGGRSRARMCRETLAAVIKGEPDWDVLPADTPSNIRTLLFRCLQKDIKKRVRDAGDIVIECEQAVTSSATSAAAPPTVAPIFSRRSLVVGLAGSAAGRLHRRPRRLASESGANGTGQPIHDDVAAGAAAGRLATPRLPSRPTGDVSPMSRVARRARSSFTCGRWTAWRESPSPAPKALSALSSLPMGNGWDFSHLTG